MLPFPRVAPQLPMDMLEASDGGGEARKRTRVPVFDYTTHTFK